MFNLGFSELLILGIIALVFIGPKQLPEVAKVVGRLLNEWKRATSDLTSSLTDSEPFRDWEERKQKYLADVDKESTSNATEEEQKQMEMNLEDPNESTRRTDAD